MLCFLYFLFYQQLQYTKSIIQYISYFVMTSVRVTQTQVQKFCNSQVEVLEGVDLDTESLLYIKFIRNDMIDQLNISECLQFNKCVLGQPQSMVFSKHFLKIEQEVSNHDVVGLVTQPYTTTLSSYIKQKKISQKEALTICDQILKAIYSLYQEGYATRNLRSEHFVLSDNIWKLSALVFDQNYKQANGVTIQYLWNPRYQAPQCFKKTLYTDDQFDPMIVWNLGSILVEMLLRTHKLSTLQTMDLFKGTIFSFQALKIPQSISSKFSSQLKETLQYMLHYDPKKRTKLTQLFQNKMLSPEVAKHYQIHKKNTATTKIALGKSSVKMSQIDPHTQKSLKSVNKVLEDRFLDNKKLVLVSRVSNILNDDQFLQDLREQSSLIPHKKASEYENEKPKTIDEIMDCSNKEIRKALQLYKSFFDQSELLIQAIEIIDKLQFVNLSSKQVNQLKSLIRYSITFVSLINLNTLAEGFNQNRNILGLDGYIYTAFQSCDKYTVFQKIVNFKRQQRAEKLNALKKQIITNKEKSLLSKNLFLSNMLNLDYKKTNFQTIKVSYRFIVKYAYDTIADQYNQLKNTDMADKLAKTAMYVTFCLTIDKLYIKNHIPDNFKFYFEWIKKPVSNYVPLNLFKKYLNEAPKQVLIEHSRFILKKYYNI